MFGVIKNASNEFCPEVEQPTENNVSILPEMLDQLEIDENDDDCKQNSDSDNWYSIITEKQSKILRSRYKCVEKSISH